MTYYNESTAWEMKVLPAEMFDESLISLITDKCERLNKLTQLIIGDYKESIDTINAGINIDVDKNRAREMVKSLTKDLSEYVLEASIRWLDTKDVLQKCYGRTKMVSNVFLLK